MIKHGRKAKLSEEAKMKLMEKSYICDRLVEKWKKTDIGWGLADLYTKNPTKARNVALLVENQEKHLKRLTETIISQSFGTRPENVLKVVRIGTANSNRGDFCTEFPLTTTDDAIYFIDMLYESTLRGSTASELIYEKINRYYAGEMEETASTSTGTQFSITANKYPIIAGKTLVMYSRRLVGIESTAGTITPVITSGSANLTSSPTATYQTVAAASGVVKVEFDTSVTGSNIVILTQFDSEKSTLHDQYGKVSLSVRKERFNARPMPLGYTFTTMTELVLGTTGIGNVEDMLVSTVADEHSKSRDYKAVGILRSIALTQTQYTFDADFAAAGEISNKSHAQKILAKIGTIGGAIRDDLKRGEINKIICGSQALEYLKFHDLWVTDTTQVRTGVYLAGKLDAIDVYCCPADTSLVSNNEMILTWKNPLEGMDVGLAFGVLTEITASLAYPQFYTDANVASVEDYLILNKKFVKLLTISNLTKAFS